MNEGQLAWVLEVIAAERRLDAARIASDRANTELLNAAAAVERAHETKAAWCQSIVDSARR